ncbi:MAG: hypothetical protein JWP10_241 [Nocardioidaceae bacterium]|nr:hypothetical protein [Nocardioidaceae bacterium]
MTTALAPTQLTLGQLIEVTTSMADNVRAGMYEVHTDTENRWHVRIHCDDQVDVWLISWTKDQATQLHDHGGSSGAFTVVSGQLDEVVWSGELDEHARKHHDTVVFGPHYVHDVRNTRDEVAVSVHAYSPPLSLMNYYDVEDGTLLKLASAWTDDPEAPAPVLRAVS